MINKPTGWYVFDGVDQVDSPALVIYTERVKNNIALAVKMAGNVWHLRPHVKTHKCKEAVLLQLEAGISKFKCATIAEAEMVGMCRAADVLLAYQPVCFKIKRFIALIKKYPHTKFSCLVDSHGTAENISAEALTARIQITVYIDINVGMGRTGIAPGKVLELYKTVSLLKGVKPIGLHAYDGHIHDTDIDIRNGRAKIIYDDLQKLQKAMTDDGMLVPVIIAGGTPTFPYYAARQDVECSPGTFIYWDAGYSELFREQGFLPAALLITRVISLPTDTKICLDLGHKAVAAESTIDKRVRFLNAPGLKIVSQSEEHLIVEAEDNHGYKPGDVIYAIPYHVCPTVALYDKAITVENNRITGEWLAIARNRKITV